MPSFFGTAIDRIVWIFATGWKVWSSLFVQFRRSAPGDRRTPNFQFHHTQTRKVSPAPEP